MKTAVLVATSLLLLSCRPPEAPPAGESRPAPPVTRTNAPPETATIVEASPPPGRQASVTIESVEASNPLRVRGTARTFENAVSLRVRSREGVLASVPVTAVGEIGQFNPWSAEIWLTRMPSDGFVTVDAIDYSAKDGSIASIASRDAALTAGPMKVSLSFPLGDCTKFGMFEREVPKTVSVARLLAEALVAGPSPAERRAGATAAFTPGPSIRSVLLRDGVLTVDLDERLRNVGGSCAATAIRESLTRTMKALPSVRRVVITAGGSEQLALQP